MAAGIHEGWSVSAAISMDGASSDQKLAAIITPAAKPSIPSRKRRLTSLKKNTTLAPSAVTNQVKQVARNACIMGLSWENHSMNMFPCSGNHFTNRYWFIYKELLQAFH
jgi:hypothetical protein